VFATRLQACTQPISSKHTSVNNLTQFLPHFQAPEYYDEIQSHIQAQNMAQQQDAKQPAANPNDLWWVFAAVPGLCRHRSCDCAQFTAFHQLLHVIPNPVHDVPC
jgi:hypothetical protein